jgi:hypothetical protein
MGFMRNAPRKEKGGFGRLGYRQNFRPRKQLKAVSAKKKSRPEAGFLGPAAGLDLSQLSEFERHRGCGSGSRRRAAEVQTGDGPKPRNHPLGDGEHIRRARHIRLLSCYLEAYALFPKLSVKIRKTLFKMLFFRIRLPRLWFSRDLFFQRGGCGARNASIAGSSVRQGNRMKERDSVTDSQFHSK